jgi:hypothetical protein
MRATLTLTLVLTTYNTVDIITSRILVTLNAPMFPTLPLFPLPQYATYSHNSPDFPRLPKMASKTLPQTPSIREVTCADTTK